MARNPRYDILFEPLEIGPVTAPNRFYCTPHAVGAGNERPHTRAGIREVRAEGGWGVVNTGYCSIHPSSDDSPLNNGRLWDDEDIRSYEPMVEAVHRHGALAGVELWHGGSGTGNRYTRMPLISASGIDGNTSYPGWINLSQSRPMDKDDIRAFRQWHVDAAKRAMRAGFDIIYMYTGMSFGPYQFLLPWLNNRTDEYGGSLENRIRLTREILEDLKEAVGDQCAVALRFSSEYLLDVPGENLETEAHEVISMLSDLPDLWDIKSSSWTTETQSARFCDSGAQEPWTSFVKPLTDKPVVGVGRFTSPDEMVSQIKRGVVDLIGAARPSIADPFLPKKIDEGREDEIRECIGCNICVSGYHDAVPVRCTQNPTMGEEWRRSWHPERVDKVADVKSVLVVGAGPAGLECSRVLGERGFEVTLVEASEELGGRVSRESTLPGLSTWARVRDYRVGRLQTMANVEVYRGSEVSADDVIEFGCDHAVIATGARWTTQVLGSRAYPEPGFSAENIYTPDDILDGADPDGPVVIYDFNHYYMGSCLAELLRSRDEEVTLVTPAAGAAAWTFMNNESDDIRRRLMDIGVQLVFERRAVDFDGSKLQIVDIHDESKSGSVVCGSVIIVGVRERQSQLYDDLMTRDDRPSIRTVGDCHAPGIIAHAVYSGHECGRELESDVHPFRRERPLVSGL